MAALEDMDRQDRIAWFNAKRFVCFQLAKILDTLQNPLRRTFQSLGNGGSETARGIKIDDLLSQRLHDTPAARIGSGRDCESRAQLYPQGNALIV